MRPDRFITLNVVRPLLRLREAALSSVFRPPSSAPRLPILMYHSIADDPELGVTPYYKVGTSPRRFAEQMHLLAEEGYQGVTLSEGLAWLHHGGEGKTTDHGPRTSDLPSPISHLRSPQPVAITFDDGFRDFLTAAFPVLQQHRFRATMFVATGFIGDHGPRLTPHASRFTSHAPHPTAFDTKDFLSWADIAGLHRAGIEFGSHTVSHPVLYDLTWPEIESEMRDSKSEIEDRLGARVKNFAYPFAFPQADRAFGHRFRALLANVGYTCCVTTEVRRARCGDGLFELPRLPVNADDDNPLLAAKLAGYYDWLAYPQAAVKHVKRALRPKPKRTEPASVRLETSIG